MKLIFPYYFLLLFLPSILNGQSLEWAFKLEGDVNEAHAVVSDNEGNVYVAGRYIGMVDFAPGIPDNIQLANGSGGDGYVAKYDSLGALVWVEVSNGSNTDHIDALWIDSTGYLYCAGTAVGGAGYVHKRNAATGAYIWGKSFYHSSSSLNYFVYADDVAVDDSGNVFVIGEFWLNTTFNQNPSVQLTSAGFNDIYIVKLDSLGNFLWVRTFGSTDSDNAFSLAIDPSGNVFCAGTYSMIVDFDPGPGVYNSPSGDDREYLLKLSGNGDFQWVLFGNNISGFAQITADNYSNVYKVKGDEVIKYDANGTVVWIRQLTSAGAIDVTVDEYGNIVSAGIVSSATNDFDPGPGVFAVPYFGYNDSYVSRLNQNGDFISAISLIGNGSSPITGVSACNGNIFCAGEFSDTADFDPSPGIFNLIGANETFVWKLGHCNAITSVSLTGCDTIVFNGQLYFDTGNYFLTYTTASGCDSTILLNLTINHGVMTPLNVTACDSFQYNGSGYYNSGMYPVYYTTAAGCDSIVMLTLTINDSYSNTSTVAACTGYTFGGTYLTTSGTYSDLMTTVAGCDSLEVLNLTINPTVNVPLTINACNNYNFNGSQLTSSGIYYDSLSTVNGCDSVIELNLTINYIDTAVTQVGGTFSLNDTTLFCYWVDCNNNYQLIPGQTSSSFTPLLNGNYAVVVFGSGCTDTSACYTINNVGIKDISENDLLVVYPNPFEEIVNLQFNDHIQLESPGIEVLDAVGRTVLTISAEKIFLASGMYSLNLASFPSGIYLIKYQAEGNLYLSRMIKQ